MFSFLSTKQTKNFETKQPAVFDFDTISNSQKEISAKNVSEKRGFFNWAFGITKGNAKDLTAVATSEPLLTDINSKVLKMKSIEIDDSEFIDVGNGKLSYAEVALFKVPKASTNKESKLKSVSDEVVIIDQDLDLGKSITDMEMIEEYKKHKQFDSSDLFNAPPPEDEWDDYVESKVPIKMRKKKNLKKNKN